MKRDSSPTDGGASGGGDEATSEDNRGEEATVSASEPSLERLRLETMQEQARAKQEIAKTERKKARLRYYEFLLKVATTIGGLLMFIFGVVRRFIGMLSSWQ